MIQRLLIANRGEIALRIIRSCKKLGIETVGLRLQSESPPLHCEQANHTFELEGESLAETFLCAESIIQAAKATNSDAIHPGYGFLSEDADFAAKVVDADIIFVGPSASALRQLGLKDRARALAKKLEIPTVPGFSSDSQEFSEYEAAAEDIGFPVLLKASAGGGGRGLTVVENRKELQAAWTNAKRDAGSYFGNETIILEKLITKPRHIEIQLLADSFGSTIHLFERDCSIQRRYQKVLEMSPAPGIAREHLEPLFQNAVAIAVECKLTGAATAEFLLSDTNEHYFLEVNPRIQVEHPVTEAVTGIDIVEQQLLIASGEALAFSQEEIEHTGAAIEARIYAEIPELGFIPSTGVIKDFNIPRKISRFSFDTDIRLDSAVSVGDNVNSRFDPMLAKLICRADSLSTAQFRLLEALQQTSVWGLGTNIASLLSILKLPSIEEQRNYESVQSSELAEQLLPIAACASVAIRLATAANDSFFRSSNWRMLGATGAKSLFSVSVLSYQLDEERHFDLALSSKVGDSFFFECQDKKYELTLEPETIILSVAGDSKLRLKLGSHRDIAQQSSSDTMFLTLDGNSYVVSRTMPEARTITDISEHNNSQIVSPLPGIVIACNIKAGQSIRRGELLAVVESMKIEHRIEAPRDGVIHSVSITQGQSVKRNEMLCQLEEIDSTS